MNAPTGRVLVIGGTGFIGGATLVRLVSEGREVRALARSPEAERTLRTAGAEPVRGDVLDPVALESAMRGCDTVFHMAGVNAMCVRDPRPMLRANVEGSGNVVAAAAAARVRRVVYTSSAAAIGEAEGTIGSEVSEHRGWFLSSYERSKCLAEERILSWGRELGIEVVSVNPASVQGPGRLEGSARLLLDVANDRLPTLVDTWLSVVDIADCAEGHLLAGVNGAPGARYILSGATLSTREAVELLRGITSHPRRVLWVPRGLVLAGGWAAEAAMHVGVTDLPLCREVVRTLLHGHRFDGSRAERELGLRYTPIERTLRRTLAWYAERGLAPEPLDSPGSKPRT